MTDNTLRSVTIERTRTGHFTATNPRGGTISFGTSSDPDGGADFTPVELLLAAIGAAPRPTSMSPPHATRSPRGSPSA